MTSAVYGAAGQVAALAVYAAPSCMRGRVGLRAALAPYGPPKSRYAETGQIVGLVPWARADNQRARASRGPLEKHDRLRHRDADRYDSQRSWAYVMDGHWYYVLDLGPQGTFLYDLTTKISGASFRLSLTSAGTCATASRGIRAPAR